MMHLVKSRILEEDKKIPNWNQSIILGPSGFREKAFKLLKIAFRVGLYVGWKSEATPSTFVIMITASHNPPEYNGLKISNIQGQSFDQSLNLQINNFVNNRQQSFIDVLTFNQNIKSTIFIGRDTRESSPQIYSLVKKGLNFFNCNVMECEQVTTPELYSYCFCYRNRLNGITKSLNASEIKERLILSTISNFQQGAKNLNWNRKKLVIDCGNGVGGKSIQNYIHVLERFFELTAINTNNFSKPNQLCGSDFIECQKKFPQNFPLQIITKQKIIKCVSFDGDGDRIIYFFKQPTHIEPILFNGDRICSIFSIGLHKIISIINQTYKTKYELAVICTISSNKGFVNFIKDKKLKIEMTNIGISYLCNSVKKYEICVYFETSGHGSVFLSLDTVNFLERIENKIMEVRLLLSIFKLCLNNCRGDGFRNMLSFQLIQQYLNMENQQLFLYDDYFISSLNIVVKNKNKLLLSSDEKQVLGPETISSFINQKKIQFPEVDILCRKSTTEDYIRVKLQGKQQLILKKLMYQIQNAIVTNPQLNSI